MGRAHLETYLNDHLAGAQAALDLLAHLERVYSRTPLAEFCATLRADIRADRDDLAALVQRLGLDVSRVRQAAGWASDKAGQLKLRLDDPAAGPLYLFEALEVVAIGIDGKRALWDALAAAAGESPDLRGVNYERLARRAQEQRARVEEKRRQAAKAALASDARRSERPLAAAAKD